MAIEIDLLSLKKRWYLPGGHLRFLVSVDFGEELPQLDDLVEISSSIADQLEDQGSQNPARGEGWVLTKSGWTGVLVNAHTIDDGLEWLELFTAIWGAGLSGRILGASPSSNPNRAREPDLVAYLAYTTGDLAALPRSERIPLWFVEDGLTRYLADRAVTWAYTRGCRQFLMRDPEWWVEPVGLEHSLALAEGIKRYTFCMIQDRDTTIKAERIAEFRPQGTARYRLVDPTADWAARLDRVREVLRWSPPNTDLGFIRHEVGPSSGWDCYHQPWPYVTEDKIRYNRPLLASFVPDANGIQLLTDAHLERAHDLSRWEIHDLGAGRHLVQWPDLAAWYSTPNPDPATLAQAREDFAGMILTPELVETHNPWPEKRP